MKYRIIRDKNIEIMRHGTLRTTIKDIARYTGFSVTTISLVLNGKAKKIPKQTKDVILEAADRLNYHPNQVAVGLVKKRTNTIGLIISDVSNVFFSNLAKGVEDECRRQDWNLILCNTNDKHSRDISYIQVLADKGVDGILFCMALDSSKKKGMESIGLMEKLKIPFVMIDRFLEGARCCFVSLNHELGGYMATEHLLKLGHRRIGCVTGPDVLEDSMARLTGYKKALAEYEIDFEPSLLYHGNYDRESGINGADYLVDKDVSAIFAFNDMCAYGVYNRLKRLGKSVPEDISLVGYDNIFFSEILDVPLTSVEQPVYEMGVEAVKQLIDGINSGNCAEKSILFQPRLIVRESTSEYKER